MLSISGRALRAALVPAAVLATVMTMERAKLRSIVLHWTRPARLAFRAFVARLIYAGRFVRRLPRLMVRLARRRHSPAVRAPGALADEPHEDASSRVPRVAQRRPGAMM